MACGRVYVRTIASTQSGSEWSKRSARSACSRHIVQHLHAGDYVVLERFSANADIVTDLVRLNERVLQDGVENRVSIREGDECGVRHDVR